MKTTPIARASPGKRQTNAGVYVSPLTDNVAVVELAFKKRIQREASLNTTVYGLGLGRLLSLSHCTSCTIEIGGPLATAINMEGGAVTFGCTLSVWRCSFITLSVTRPYSHALYVALSRIRTRRGFHWIGDRPTQVDYDSFRPSTEVLNEDIRLKNLSASTVSTFQALVYTFPRFHRQHTIISTLTKWFHILQCSSQWFPPSFHMAFWNRVGIDVL
jgi:hypothetical protein